MNRLYFFATVLVLIIIPHTVDSFFLQNLANISVTTNISCYLNNNTASVSGFQFCAIRTYYADVATNLLSFTVYDGLRYMNSLSRFMQNRCNNSQNLSKAGTGQAVCYPIASFETFNYLNICICATKNCNQNFTSCQASAAITTDLELFSSLTPDITAHTQCNDTLNASITCTEQPFINTSVCEGYVKNNSVLCAITVINGNITIRTALIYEDYDRYLTEKIYELNLASHTNEVVPLTQTDTNFYYFLVTALLIGECSCTNFSLCNQNINLCINPTTDANQDTTTITATATTTTTMIANATVTTGTNNTTALTDTNAFTVATNATMIATVTNSITAATATNAITASTNATTAATATNAFTATAATNAITAATATNAFTAATATNAFTAAAATNAFTAAAATNAFTAVAGTNVVTAAAATNAFTAATATNAITAAANATTAATATNALAATVTNTITNMATNTITTSSNLQSPGSLESGLGSAATAGLACGIIFSAILFSGQIIFFKFFYHGGTGGGSERSVAYRA